MRLTSGAQSAAIILNVSSVRFIRFIRICCIYAAFAVVLGLSCKTVRASSLFQLLNPVRLEWDASPDPKVVGYRLNIGANSRFYSFWLDVGNTNAAYLPSMLLALSNYISVTA